MTLRPTSDWLILKPESKVIQSNLIEIDILNFCFKDNNNNNNKATYQACLPAARSSGADKYVHFGGPIFVYEIQ